MPASIKKPLFFFSRKIISSSTYMMITYHHLKKKEITIPSSRVYIKIFQDDIESDSLTSKADGSLPLRLTSNTEDLTSS